MTADVERIRKAAEAYGCDCRIKKNEAGEVFLVRCPKCGRENYAPNVASGICTWCGYNAKNDYINIDKHG